MGHILSTGFCFSRQPSTFNPQDEDFLSNLSLENFAVHMVVSRILPSLNSSAINVRGKSKMSISGWPDLDTVTVGQWNRQVNCTKLVPHNNEMRTSMEIFSSRDLLF